MVTTKTIVLNVNGEEKRLQFDFEYVETGNKKGVLNYSKSGEDFWQYWDMLNYDNQEDAIKGFCNEYWKERLVAIE